MFGLGVGEIVVILVIALIFIGPKKLPELARGLGRGLSEFQNAAKGLTQSIKEEPPVKVAEDDNHSHEAHVDHHKVADTETHLDPNAPKDKQS